MVTLIGGPEDGREVDVPVDRLEDLPPQINSAGWAAPPEVVDAADVTGDPSRIAGRFVVHVYRRDGLTTRYAFEGTT